MTTGIRLSEDDMFSESYLEAFYRAHVASRRGSLDEDIAAIEAEIRKVQQYQCRFRSYRWESALNSCGSSECSDDEEIQDLPEETSPTSVFKVYNSSMKDKESLMFLKGPDVFSWAAHQRITHDHGYCRPEHMEPHTPIDHGTIHMKNVHWHLLTSPKRAQVIRKLAHILQHQPSDPVSPSCSSLNFLPQSLAASIRRNGSLGISSGNSLTKKDGGGKARTKHTGTASCQKIDIKEIKAKQRTQSSLASTPVRSVGTGGPATRSSSRKKYRHSPYERSGKAARQMEAVRVRNSSTCSEDNEDPIVID